MDETLSRIRKVAGACAIRYEHPITTRRSPSAQGFNSLGYGPMRVPAGAADRRECALDNVKSAGRTVLRWSRRCVRGRLVADVLGMED